MEERDNYNRPAGYIWKSHLHHRGKGFFSQYLAIFGNQSMTDNKMFVGHTVIGFNRDLVAVNSDAG